MGCQMYAALKILNPAADVRLDLAQEYAVVQRMKRGQSRC
jgi:hypothetical protein